jgi:hypothetical protein
MTEAQTGYRVGLGDNTTATDYCSRKSNWVGTPGTQSDDRVCSSCEKILCDNCYNTKDSCYNFCCDCLIQSKIESTGCEHDGCKKMMEIALNGCCSYAIKDYEHCSRCHVFTDDDIYTTCKQCNTSICERCARSTHLCGECDPHFVSD